MNEESKQKKGNPVFLKLILLSAVLSLGYIFYDNMDSVQSMAGYSASYDSEVMSYVGSKPSFELTSGNKKYSYGFEGEDFMITISEENSDKKVVLVQGYSGEERRILCSSIYRIGSDKPAWSGCDTKESIALYNQAMKLVYGKLRKEKIEAAAESARSEAVKKYWEGKDEESIRREEAEAAAYLKDLRKGK